MSVDETQLVLNMQAMVLKASALLETRWTFATLRRHDPEIARKLHDQRNVFVESCVTGRPRDIVKHAEGLCRGYVAAARVLEEAGERDDAYLIGVDVVTGLRVAIGPHRDAIPHIRQQCGPDVIWLTPDEVARMVAGAEAFKRAIVAVKRVFPGAELVDQGTAQGDEADAS